MAIIKCKMCGGDLRIEEGTTVCECEYCGTRQTVPSADNEKKLTLFSRAGRLLRGCEFDKASGVFETIVADFPEEAEAYWGLVLCKYGIEYVDDPATGKKVPTCHRSSFESVLDDPNFEQACENTDAVARRVYRDEARQIEDLRQAILQVSGKEEPYDVFISYKETDENGDRTLDSVIAQDIYKELTGEGYRVFFSRISLEDKLGTEYEPYIFAALNSAKVMLVVGTDYENFDSVWVKNEWSRFLKLIAAGQKKTLIPVFKNMDAYDMPKEFAKLAAQDMGKVGAMQDLVRGVEKIVGKKKTETVKETVVVQQGGENTARVTAAMERGYMALEDGEFGKAVEYFDQVLSLDAKNARAYYGMALAKAKCRDAAAYIDRICGFAPATENIELPADAAHIREAAEKYTVPGYLSAEEIIAQYVCKPSYPSTVRSQKQLCEQARSSFENNRDFTRALQFAEGEAKEKLDELQKNLFDRLDKAVKKAETAEENAKTRAEQDYRSFLENKDGLAAEKSQKAEKRREADYSATVTAFKVTKGCVELTELKKSFTAFGTYKDAKDYVSRCEEKIAEAEKVETEAAERQRILAEKAEKEKKARNTKLGIIAGIVAAVAIAAIFIVTKVVIPRNQYKAAEALFEAGQYEEAIAAFEAMAGYRDSETRIADVNAAIRARDYNAAKRLFEAGDYLQALEAFQALEGYEDSEELLTETYYRVALSALESQDYEAAAEQLAALGQYKDCAELANEAKYQWAINLISTGPSADYDKNLQSFSLFAELGSYKDVEEYLDHFLYVRVADKYTGTGRTARFTYDNSGRLSEVNVSNARTRENLYLPFISLAFSYDTQNNFVPEGYDIEYDSSGRISSYSSQNTKWQVQYNQAGLVQKKESESRWREVFEYEYEDDLLVKATHTTSDKWVTVWYYSYNQDGKISEAKFVDYRSSTPQTLITLTISYASSGEISNIEVSYTYGGKDGDQKYNYTDTVIPQYCYIYSDAPIKQKPYDILQCLYYGITSSDAPYLYLFYS